MCLQIKKISQADINTEIIFNCQMGRGRTTTGMVIATLVYFKRTGASGISSSCEYNLTNALSTNYILIEPNLENIILNCLLLYPF